MDPRLTKKINQLYKIQRELDYLNHQKQLLRMDVEDLIIKNRLHNKKLSIGDRYVTYRKIETNQGLTQKYLNDTLTEYFDDATRAQRVLKFILDNREKKSKYTLEMNKKKQK